MDLPSFASLASAAPASQIVEHMADGDLARRLVALHERFTPSQRELARHRPRGSVARPWYAPADDARAIVDALNSDAPIVVLDLERLSVDRFSHLLRGIANVRAALHRELVYARASREIVRIARRRGIASIRIRGIDIGQPGIIPGEPIAAAIYDLASIFYRLDLERLEHPLHVSIPPCESRDERRWWNDVFAALADSRNRSRDYIVAIEIEDAYPNEFTDAALCPPPAPDSRTQLRSLSGRALRAHVPA